jgi:muramidase (phage lysozyme)
MSVWSVLTWTPWRKRKAAAPVAPVAPPTTPYPAPTPPVSPEPPTPAPAPPKSLGQRIEERLKDPKREVSAGEIIREETLAEREKVGFEPLPPAPVPTMPKVPNSGHPAMDELGVALDLPQDVRVLLAFIGKVEAPKGYNQMFGERQPAYALTNMSLDEVLEVQDRRVRAGARSSAAGRYQFLRATLRGLKQQGGFTGKERFDSTFQDGLAFRLLVGRGYRRYKQGLITLTDFANNVAKEWASMPVVSGPKKGKSHYDGDGLNSSLVSVESFLAACRGQY